MMNYTKNENKHFGIFFKIFVATIVTVTISLVLLSCSKTETIVLSDYLSLEPASGMNGFGNINYSLDKGKLFEDVLGKVSVGDNSSENESKLEDYEKLCDELMKCIVVKKDKANGELSNGDEVSFEIGFESANSKYDFDKIFVDGTLTKKVEGLEDPKELNVFDSKYFSVSFYGIDGHGKMDIDGYWKADWQRGIKYTFSKEDNFCNGDIITVTAELDAGRYDTYLENLMDDGYVVSQKTSTEIEVSGLRELASSEDITYEVIEQAKEDAMTYFNSHYDNEGDSFNVNIVGVYLKDKNDKTEPYDNSSWDGLKYYTTLNVIISYEKPGFSPGSGIERTMSIIFTDIALDEDGNVLPLPSPEDEDWVSYCCTEIDVMGAFFKDIYNYTVTKLQ